jgi:hypothetical protein
VFWLDITRHFLRARARQPENWRDRLTIGGLYLAAGSWSAIAPQSRLSLGDRLHLAFETISVLTTAFAILVAFRHPSRPLVPAVARGFGDLLPALPLFAFLLAIQSISLSEVSIAIVVPVLILTVGLAVGPIFILPIGAMSLLAMRHRSWFEASLITLYAAHFYVKIRFAFEPLRNLDQLLRFNPFQVMLLLIAFVHIALLASIRSWPLDAEQSLGLAILLISGMISLYLDASALHWRHVLKINPLTNLAVVLGIPWAVAWVFATLRAGDAFTLNEMAGYFILWSVVGGILSRIVGVSAKQKVQANLISLSLFPSGEVP